MSNQKKKSLFSKLFGKSDCGCCCSSVEIIPEEEIKEDKSQKAERASKDETKE